MASFGERLRREREMRGITLEEIAAATKIGTRNLKALEDEQFKILPGGIFNKGFVRAYARFLGINEDQAIADYVAASGAGEETSVDSAQLLAQREEVEARSRAARDEAKKLGKLDSDASGIPWAALAGLLLVIALAWGARVGYVKYQARKEAQMQAQQEAQRREVEKKAAEQAAAAQAAQAAMMPRAEQPKPEMSTQAQPAQAPATTQTSASTPAPETKTQPAAPAKPASTQQSPQAITTPVPGSFVVSLRARQRVWVSVTADGKHVMSGELEAAAQRDFQAHDHLTIRTGNAGGTDLALNGKPLPPLGAESQVRTVTINADGTMQ